MHKKKNTSPKIYVQIRKMLLLGIVIALGLSLGVSFLLNLIQESRSRDQTLSSAAQVAANTPVLMEDIHHTRPLSTSGALSAMFPALMSSRYMIKAALPWRSMTWPPAQMTPRS